MGINILRHRADCGVVRVYEHRGRGGVDCAIPVLFVRCARALVPDSGHFYRQKNLTKPGSSNRKAIEEVKRAGDRLTPHSGLDYGLAARVLYRLDANRGLPNPASSSPFFS